VVSEADRNFIISMLEMNIHMAQDQASGELDPGELWDHFRDLRDTYNDELSEINQKDKDDKERKEFEKQEENLARALPNITKGTLAAINAFQRKPPDAISGSAALIDICASITPMIAGLSAAGGPPGMVVGAIFSVISQILSFFAPTSESLGTQLANALKEMKAEDMKIAVAAARDSVSTHAISLRKTMLATNKLLEDRNKKTDGKFADGINDQIIVLDKVIKQLDLANPLTRDKLWTVSHWLQEEKNQVLDAWPTTLAAWCQLYTELRLTTTMVSVLANTAGMRKRFEEAEGLGEAGKKAVRKSLTKLRTTAAAHVIVSDATTVIAAEHIENLVAPARNRGLLWQIDPTSTGYLYGGTNILKGKFPYMNAQGTRIAIAASEKALSTPTPTYHIFHVKGGASGGTFHGIWRYPYKDPPSWDDFTGAAKGLTDIWATVGDRSNKSEIYFYGAKDDSIIGFVLDENNKVRDGNYRPKLKSKAISVRVVRNPSWIPDDPDAGVEGARLQQQPYITYGGCEGSRDIFVDYLGSEPGYVPSPWTHYRGLGVDSHYLWAFGSGGFACATHASAIRCRNKKIDQPRWMEHYPNDLLYTQSFRTHDKDVKGARPELKGLLDLSPCVDGTLVAAIAQRTAIPLHGVWTIFDDAQPPLYAGTYETDLQAQKIDVEWRKLPEGTAGVVVQKLPVPCWSMLESLYESIAATAAANK
jgi:hypothetical protein